MIIYNLDNTKGSIPQERVEEWQKKNDKIVFISRHNTEYIAGLLRQLGLPNAIMIGANMVRIGIEQPPEFFKQCSDLEEALYVVKNL